MSGRTASLSPGYCSISQIPQSRRETEDTWPDVYSWGYWVQNSAREALRKQRNTFLECDTV